MPIAFKEPVKGFSFIFPSCTKHSNSLHAFICHSLHIFVFCCVFSPLYLSHLYIQVDARFCGCVKFQFFSLVFNQEHLTFNANIVYMHVIFFNDFLGEITQNMPTCQYAVYQTVHEKEFSLSQELHIKSYPKTFSCLTYPIHQLSNHPVPHFGIRVSGSVLAVWHEFQLVGVAHMFGDLGSQFHAVSLVPIVPWQLLVIFLQHHVRRFLRVEDAVNIDVHDPCQFDYMLSNTAAPLTCDEPTLRRNRFVKMLTV